MMTFSDEARKEGFEIFKKGLVRRLSPTHFAARKEYDQGWQLVELKSGKWVCDCQTHEEPCPHLYAALLQRTTSKLQPEPLDEEHLKCRYCGSPDVARCGFRYNARGISRRYKCNECERKFSIVHVQNNAGARPSELTWLLNEIGMLTARLTDLLIEVNERMEVTSHFTENATTDSSLQETDEDKKA